MTTPLNPEPLQSGLSDVANSATPSSFQPGSTIFRTADDQPAIPAVRPILPDGEAILQPPIDNTPTDPRKDPPARIPNLGHALIFLSLTGALLLISNLIILGLDHPSPHHPTAIAPKLLILTEAFTYLSALTISWFLFPVLWQRPFAEGLQLNPNAAARNAFKLIPLGFILSFTVQAVSSIIPMPKTIPMDDFFRTSSDVWLISAFGTIVAPLFEEIVFRGFLFPAFAIAYDWLCLPRTEAALEEWHSSNKLTFASMVFSAVLSSIFFAALHGKQVAFTWPVLILLFGVSLILTTIRIRLRSVLASTLVHASYNLAIFLTAFIATGGFRHLERMTR
jgi:membrane protease YdiL (CAAX protease family)